MDERGQRIEKFKGVGKVKEGTCLKRKVELSEGALKPQKSQECCRRKEGSGRIPIEGQETRRKRRKVLQKGWGNEEEGERRAKRPPKEFEGRERFRKNGLDHHRTSGGKGMEQTRRGQRKIRKKESSGRKAIIVV